MCPITESLQIKTVEMINTFSAKPKHKQKKYFNKKMLHSLTFLIVYVR